MAGKLWETTIKARAIRVKGYVALTLLLLMVWFTYEVVLQDGLDLSCGAATSTLRTSLCTFRYVVAVVAAVLLLPFLYESYVVGAVLLNVLDGTSTALVDEKGFVLAVDEAGMIYFNGSAKGLWVNVPLALCKLPLKLVGIGGTPYTAFLQSLVLVEIIQTLILPFVAVIIVLAAESPSDILLAFVAGQVFSSIDDTIVKLVVTRKSNVHDVLTPFFFKVDEKEYNIEPFTSMSKIPRVLVAYGLAGNV